MAVSIYTTQEPASQEAGNYHLGPRFSTSEDANVVGGRAWVPAGGRPSTFIWQLWRVSDSTLLAECDLNTLPTPTDDAWMEFTSDDFDTPGDVPIVTTETYIVDTFPGTGNQIVYSGGFSYPLVNDILTAIEGRFVINAAQATMPNQVSTNEGYFADVIVESGAEMVTVNLTPATATLTAQALNPVPGVVTVALTPAAATLMPQALNPVPGVVTVALTPATATLAAQPLNAVPGMVSTTLTPATAVLEAQPLSVVPGTVSVALTPAVASLAAQVLNAVPGMVTVNLTPAIVALTAVPLSVGTAAPGTHTPGGTSSTLAASGTAAALTPSGTSAVLTASGTP